MSSPLLSPKNTSQSRPKSSRHRFKRRRHREPFLVNTSFQNGSIRHDPEDRARPEKWRHNLAALSHQHNLYIVAYNEELHVFEPEYPRQNVSSRACLIIELPVSDPDLSGHIRPERPHSVNHLIIEQLGEQEIVLCSCDDGDVVAYSTDSIFNAIERRRHGSGSQGRMADDVRPFFRANVGQSAWGLAVHTKARKIAISANTHQTTIFSFALSTESESISWSDDDSSGSSSDSTSGSEETRQWTGKYNISGVRTEYPVVVTNDWHVITRYTRMSSLRKLLSDRTRNTCTIFELYHHANIPTVAFLNSEEDPGGWYLLSADISGCVCLWNLHVLMSPIYYFSPKSRLGPFGAWGLGGWALHWIDRHSFRRVEQRKAFRRGSRFFAEQTPSQERSIIKIAGAETMMHPTSSWDPWSQLKNQAHSEITWSDVEGNPHLEEDGEPGVAITSTAGDSDSNFEADVDNSSREVTDYEGNPSPSSQSQASRRRERPPTPIPGLFSSGSLVEDEILCSDQSGSPYAQWTPAWPSDKNVYDLEMPPCIAGSIPECPIMLTRPSSICLFQSADMKKLDRSHPFTHLDDPLEQEIPERWQDEFDRLDRLNLSVQIPELGVILVGSPKGRVAVLTLHQLGNPFTVTLKPLYIMRLDDIIPFPQQEKDGQRPLFPLVAVSAGPVQGQLNRPGQNSRNMRRKWRVLLLYRDDSILAYEMWRKHEDDDALGISAMEELHVS